MPVNLLQLLLPLHQCQQRAVATIDIIILRFQQQLRSLFSLDGPSTLIIGIAITATITIAASNCLVV